MRRELSRFGGLRCPSEHLALTWGDVDWGRSRIRVPSRKTEHLEGGECRHIPLFPELRPHLLAVFGEAEERTEYVITRYRNTNANLRTQLCRIIRKAGLSRSAEVGKGEELHQSQNENRPELPGDSAAYR